MTDQPIRPDAIIVPFVRPERLVGLDVDDLAALLIRIANDARAAGELLDRARNAVLPDQLEEAADALEEARFHTTSANTCAGAVWRMIFASDIPDIRFDL